jgi:hypothetical protein
MLTDADYRRYFERRFPDAKFAKDKCMVRCPFHADSTASLSLDLGAGVWFDHGGCGSGGVLDFEQKFSKCSPEQAKENIAAVIGKSFGGGEKPEAIYQYKDASGAVLFEKLRMQGKRFTQRRVKQGGGYDYSLGNVAKPLYRLPEVLTSWEICIAEGEKDCDNLVTAFAGKRITATTNFDGAGKWRDEYAVFFAGKKVIIFPDNDDVGRAHAQRVAASVYPLALGVKVVELPGLSEKGDVSDYLKTHSVDDLLSEIKNAPRWHPKTDDRTLVSASQFLATIPEQVDWMVKDVIEIGANGFFCAEPKVGKSWAAIDLAICLSMGIPWMGFKVSRPFRVGLISREDTPGLTGWRIKHLLLGKNGDMGDFERNLYINTRQQTPEFRLENDDQLGEIIEAMSQRRIEFAIFDVFNVLHSADENDNSEMREVMAKLSGISRKVGCGLGVVHHFNKLDSGSITKRLRGSSAIAGWAEWMIGISRAGQDEIRKMEFELKAGASPDPVHFLIQCEEANGIAHLKPVDYSADKKQAGSLLQ